MSATAGALIGLASTLMSVGGNLIGSGMTNKRMRAAQRRQQQYNLELMDKAQQYNIENFNMENAYNTPLAQRERMKQAGLNPNFVDGLSPVVGQMDSVSNGSGAAGQVSPYNLGNIGEIASAAATLASIKRENKLADSQIGVNNSVKNLNDTQASLNLQQEQESISRMQGIDLENENRPKRQALENQEAQATIDKLAQEKDNMLKAKELLDSQIARQDLENNYYVDDITSKINEAKANADFQKAKTLTEEVLRDPQKFKLNAETAKAWAEVQHYKIQEEQAWYALKTDRMRATEEQRAHLAQERLQSNLNSSIIDVNKEEAKKLGWEALSAKVQWKVNTYLWYEGYWNVSYNTAREAMRRMAAEADKIEKEGVNLDNQNEMYYVNRLIDAAKGFTK